MPHVGDCVSSMSTSTTNVSATKGEKGKAKYAALNINNLYKVQLQYCLLLILYLQYTNDERCMDCLI